MRFKSEVVACGVVYAAARKFQVPLPDRWWEVFDAKWSDVEIVCKVLAELYTQPKGQYIEVEKDSKSFVLTSKAWDIPNDGQDRLIKTMVNGSTSEQVPITTSSDAGIQKEPALKTPVDNLKSTAVKDRSHNIDEVQNSIANGEVRDDPGVGKEKIVHHREGEAGDKIRDKDMYRQRLHEPRDSGRGHDAERERARGRNRDRDRRDKERERDERENTKERDYRRKERSRDTGHAEKIRHNAISREREFQMARDSDRHQHHRRQNV